MKKLIAARKLYEAGDTVAAKRYLKDVEPEIEKIVKSGDLRKDNLYNMSMFLNTLGSLGDHKGLLSACKRWQQFCDDWELYYQAGVASFNLGRFVQAVSFWSEISDVPMVSNMQFVAQLMQQKAIPAFQLEYELPDPTVVHQLLESEVPKLNKRQTPSGLLIMALLEMAFDADNAQEAAEILLPLINYTGTWGKELGTGLMDSTAVSDTVKAGVGSLLVLEGIIPEEDVFDDESEGEEFPEEQKIPDREKLSYDVKINTLVRSLRSKYGEVNLKLDTRYMDYFGDTCPMCGGPIKVRRGVVENAASVSSYLLMEQKKAVVYCICRKCAKKITRFRTNNNDEQVEAAITAKLPDLKRSRRPTKEEIQKEQQILRMLF